MIVLVEPTWRMRFAAWLRDKRMVDLVTDMI
jgi:hypothetical protein